MEQRYQVGARSSFLATREHARQAREDIEDQLGTVPPGTPVILDFAGVHGVTGAMLREHAVSRMWKATVGLVGPRRLVIVASLVAAALAAAVSVQAVAASTAPAFWKPSTAQAERVITAAYLEASSTIPGAAGHPVTPHTTAPPSAGAALIASAARASFWPSNVSSISYIGTGRQTASQFVDGSRVPDNRPVIVLRMTGHFSVAISSPPGAPSYATGTVLTAVLDATNGQVLDFGLTNAAKPLTGPVVAFQR